MITFNTSQLRSQFIQLSQVYIILLTTAIWSNSSSLLSNILARHLTACLACLDVPIFTILCSVWSRCSQVSGNFSFSVLPVFINICRAADATHKTQPGRISTVITGNMYCRREPITTECYVSHYVLITTKGPQECQPSMMLEVGLPKTHQSNTWQNILTNDTP